MRARVTQKTEAETKKSFKDSQQLALKMEERRVARKTADENWTQKLLFELM